MGPGLEQSPADETRDWRRAAAAALIFFATILCLLTFPADDGQRHVGLAFGEDRSWGAVYPFSVFEQHADYDPWWGYDRTLRAFAQVLRIIPVPRIAQQILLVKLATAILLAGFLFLTLARSGVMKAVRDRASLTAVFVLIIVFLALPLLRLCNIRPFAFGTLFLLFAIGSRGFFRGAGASLLLTFFYPYLAWLYVLPAALAHFMRGNRLFALGCASVAAAAAAFQPASFWGMLYDLALSDGARKELFSRIGEFFPISEHAPLVLSYIAFVLVLVPFLVREKSGVRVEHLLLLFFLPVSVRYIRYFIDVELVLAFLILARPAIPVLARLLTAVGAYWAGAAARLQSAIRRAFGGRDTAPRTSRHLKPWLGVLVLVLLAETLWLNHMKYLEFKNLQSQLAVIPSGSTLLTNFNPQYRILFVRPDLRLVPSCELVFPAPEIKREYLSFFNEGDPCALATRTGAAFLAEDRGTYLDPRKSGCLKFVSEFRNPKDGAALRIWSIN